MRKHQIQPDYGDEQADAGRDGWTRLARPNSQARTGTGEYSFSCWADHEQDWQPYPVDPLLYVMTIHTYINTYLHKRQTTRSRTFQRCRVGEMSPHNVFRKTQLLRKLGMGLWGGVRWLHPRNLSYTSHPRHSPVLHLCTCIVYINSIETWQHCLSFSVVDLLLYLIVHRRFFFPDGQNFIFFFFL